jgi:hypothetical protein
LIGSRRGERVMLAASAFVRMADAGSMNAARIAGNVEATNETASPTAMAAITSLGVTVIWSGWIESCKARTVV